jgi:PAS domain S-box-containing protein
MRKHIFIPLLVGLLWLISGTLSAAERTYNVLFIQSYTKQTPWHSQLTASLRDGLEKGGVTANIVTEYLNADYWAFASECFIMRRICERARQRNTDLIVTSSDEAFFTLTHCGDSLPYQIPVVVSGIKFPDKSVFDKMPNVSGYTSTTNFDVLLEEAVQMFPSRKELVCLSDSSFLSLKGVRAVKDAWERVSKKHPGYSLKTLNVQANSMNSIITSICYDYNAYKHIVIAPKWIPFLSLKLKAPVFASQNLAMTNGVLCVYDAEPGADTYVAGRQAASILKGASSASFGVNDFNGKLLFDYKQLQFFNVNIGRAESRGVIQNRPLGERYRVWFILFYSVIVGALVLLIVWLFRINRRESRRRIHAQTRLLIQQRLVEQRDEFDNIFCSIRDGLITYDTDLRIHFVNRSLVEMLGLPSDTYTARYYEGQMAGSIFRISMDGEDILHQLLKQVRAEKKPVPLPDKAFMQEIHQGVYFPVSGEVVPIFANEKMSGMAIVCRNISEEEMQRRIFSMAVEESSIHPWQYNMHLNSFHFRGGLLQRFGYTDDLITRQEFNHLIHPDDILHSNQQFDSVLNGEVANSRMSFRLRNAEGGYEWWEFRSTAYKGLTNIPYMVLGVCQSIQRYKDTEDALIAARDRALQADKLKSAFLANMSHEIRTPLNAIVGFSDLLQDLDAFSPEEVKQFVETININCTLLLALINDILDLSRIESGTMEFKITSYNLTDVMQEVYESQRLSMPRGVELRIEIPEGGGKTILTDAVRLKQVVNNLINNAKKFTVTGSITFGYQTEEPGHTTIYVEDTGSGISEEAQKHIFERFYKADSFTQGAGLGLSICQTIVDRLHGTISVSSELEKGTRFTVKLPDEVE